MYKNFAYLFQNPLWDKHIPNGFSVCPYFWLNLFSFFIFRPLFVAPIKYLILPLIRVIGKPAHVFDEWLYNRMRKINFGPEIHCPGFGIIGSTLLTITVVGSAFLLSLFGYKAYHYYRSLDGVWTSLYWFWTVASLVPLFISFFIHKIKSTTECKPEYYFVGWVALFIVSLFVFIPHHTLHALSTTFFNITHVFGHFFFVCWTGAIYGLGVFFSCLWEVLKVVFSWKPLAIMILPWWVFILAITVIGWIGEKALTWWDDRTIQSLRQENPAQLHARFRQAWMDLFIRIILEHKRWKSGEIFTETFGIYTGKAANTMKYSIIQRTFEEFWKTELDILQTSYPRLRESGWKAIASADTTNTRFWNLKINLAEKQVSDQFPRMEVDEFLTVMRDIVFKDKYIKQLAAQYKADDEYHEKRREARGDSRAHELCVEITCAIAEGSKAVVMGVWDGTRWVFANIGTFCAYMWILIKAKKQGACPYITFTDSNQNINDNINDKSEKGGKLHSRRKRTNKEKRPLTN